MLSQQEYDQLGDLQKHIFSASHELAARLMLQRKALRGADRNLAYEIEQQFIDFQENLENVLADFGSNAKTRV